MNSDDWTKTPMSSSQYDELHALLLEKLEKAEKKQRGELERQKKAEKQKDHEQQKEVETIKEPPQVQEDSKEQEQQLKDRKLFAPLKVTQGDGDAKKPVVVEKKLHICDIDVEYEVKGDSSNHTSRACSSSGFERSAFSLSGNARTRSCRQNSHCQLVGGKTYGKQLKRKNSSTSLFSSSSCRRKRRKRRCKCKKKGFNIFAFLKRRKCNCKNARPKKRKRIINLLSPPKCSCRRKKIGRRRSRKHK